MTTACRVISIIETGNKPFQNNYKLFKFWSNKLQVMAKAIQVTGALTPTLRSGLMRATEFGFSRDVITIF